MVYDPNYYLANKEKYKAARDKYRKTVEFREKRKQWHLKKLYDSIDQSQSI